MAAGSYSTTSGKWSLARIREFAPDDLDGAQRGHHTGGAADAVDAPWADCGGVAAVAGSGQRGIVQRYPGIEQAAVEQGLTGGAVGPPSPWTR